MKCSCVKFSSTLFLVIFGFIFTISGCGNLSQLSDSSSGSSNQGNKSAYLGTSSISGQVVVSEDDLAKISQSSGMNTQSLRAKALKALSADEETGISNPQSLSSGVAYLYEVLSDGTVSYTGITTNVQEGTYIFPNIMSGKKYVVSIKANGRDSLGNKNELKMDAFVDLKSGSSAAVSNVTEKSSIVTNYILEKVVKVGGNQFNTDTSQQVASKALDVVNTLLGDGSLRRLSPVTTTQNFVDSTVYEKPVNVSDTSMEMIDNSDAVRKVSQQATLESKLQKSSYTHDQAKSIIRDVFGGSDVKDTKGGGQEGPPDFFIDQFASAFERGQLVSIEDFATAFNDSLPPGGLKSEYWTKANVIAKIKAVFNSSNGRVHKLYAIYDGASDDEQLSPVMRAVFPKSPRISTPVSNQTQLNVPQMIMAMLEADLIYGATLPDQYKSSSDHGPAFDPFKLLKALQYVSIEAGHYYIIEKQLIPMKVYKEENQTWREVDALESRVQVYFEGDALSVGRVLLKYPKTSGGTGTVEYHLRAQGNTASVKALSVAEDVHTLSPKGLGSKVVLKLKGLLSAMGITQFNSGLSAKNDTGAQPSGSPFEHEWMISPFENQGVTPTYISDFKEGDAKIEVYDANGTKKAEATVKLCKFDIPALGWVYPKGMDMAKAQASGWDDDFIPSELDTDSDRRAQPLLQWEAPHITLPEGYTLAYSVDLGMSASKLGPGDFSVPGSWDHEGNQYKWKRIWSSWEEGRYIRSNSFQLKQRLPKTERSLQGNYQTTYEVNVMPLVIEIASGRVVWQGSSSRTNFFVGATSPWSIALRGTVSFNPKVFTILGNAGQGTWKIGLFKMGSPGPNGVWTDAFFNSTAGGRSPVEMNGQPVMAVLGSSTELAQTLQATYTLPEFTKTSSPLVRSNSYRLLVWCDVATAPSTSDWSFYGDPHANQIDFSQQRFLEFFETDMGDIWVDQASIRYNNYQLNTSRPLSDGSIQDQTVDIRVGKFFQ